MIHLNPFARHQPELSFTDVFPLRTDARCACGCNQPLTGRRTRWASNACMQKASEFFMIVKGHSKAIRHALFLRDAGTCAHCGNQSTHAWDADHIVPVHRGGGGCDLDNFQTLCIPCHKRKTAEQMMK